MKAEIILILNLVCLSAIFWSFDSAYRKFRIDLLRFHLFGQRDYLFAAAARGEISFDSPAYRMTRQTINGMIRFAHEVSLWRVIILIASRNFWMHSDTRAEYAIEYQSAMKMLSIGERKVVLRAMSNSNFSLVSFLLHTSILTFPFVFLLKMVIRTRAIVRGFSRMSRSIRLANRHVPEPVIWTLDSEAYYCGGKF